MRVQPFHSFWQNCLPKLWLFLSSPRIPFSWLQLEVYPDEEVCISICCHLVAWREQSTLHWQILCLYLATNAPFHHSLIPRCCTLAAGSQQVHLLVAALSLASKCARGPDPKDPKMLSCITPSSAHSHFRFLNIESKWIQPPKSTWKIRWKHVFSLHHKISIRRSPQFFPTSLQGWRGVCTSCLSGETWISDVGVSNIVVIRQKRSRTWWLWA